MPNEKAIISKINHISATSNHNELNLFANKRIIVDRKVLKAVS